jgi:hypothetical protein
MFREARLEKSGEATKGTAEPAVKGRVYAFQVCHAVSREPNRRGRMQTAIINAGSKLTDSGESRRDSFGCEWFSERKSSCCFDIRRPAAILT